jgi:hypothetical protein
MRSAIPLLAGLAMAAIALVIYDRAKVDPTTFDLDPAMFEVAETWNGITFTGTDVPSIGAMIAQQATQVPAATAACKPLHILWLGNSQLHFIENFEKGQHAAPYLLRRSLDCADTIVPMAASLPHANLQEHYVLARYAQRRLPVTALIVELSFDDLREDGLRDDFSALLTPADRAALKQNQAGTAILERAESEWSNRNTAEENPGLDGFLQKKLEDRLNSALNAHWPLWADRKWLRSRFYIDLYGLRNAALGIRSTTIRRALPQRYARNMLALRELLRAAHADRVRTLIYIAPIRQDLASPYDKTDYAAWKQQLGDLASTTGSTLLDLGALVPGDQWGPASENADFNHFKAGGHELLAAALLPFVASTYRNP